MHTFAGQFVAACWLTFYAVWALAAFRTKRSIERAAWRSHWWAFVLLAVVVVALRGAVRFAGGAVLWRSTFSIGIMADAMTGAGLLITLWSRAILGTNWSADVVVKERHELVDRGPYRVVRHPIYSGVLLMMLGTLMLWGRAAGVVVYAAVVLGLWMKARVEERLLTKYFPEQYGRYRERVGAMLVPGVL